MNPWIAKAVVLVGTMVMIPNWVAGPANLIAFGILLALRIHAEEKLMVDEFGAECAEYSAQTKRLVPGVW